MRSPCSRWFGAALLSAAAAAQATPGAPAPAAPTGRVEGRVTDVRGEGVPAAEVWVQSSGLPVVQGRCDASGAFVLAHCPLGPLEVCVRAPLHGAAMVHVSLDDDAPLRTVALVLPDGTRLSGRVTDGKGASIAGVRVLAASASASLPAEAAAMAVTDGEGRYNLDSVPLGPVRITVLAPGFRTVETQRLMTEPAVHDLALLPGGRQSLCLRIRGASPEQLAGTTCTEVLTFSGHPLPLPVRLRSGKPDERGEWRLDDLPGDLAFREHAVRVPGAEVRMGRGVKADQCFTIDFTVQAAAAPAVLAGTLVDGAGRPLPGTALRCLPDGGTPFGFETDAAGAFAVPCAMARAQNFQVVAADPALGLARSKAGGFDPKQSYALTATPAVGVTAKLTDVHGRPVRGAEVLLRAVPKGQKPVDPRVVLTTASSATGLIAIHRLVPGGNQSLVLEVRHPDGTVMSAPFELPQSGVLELPPLQLVPCSTICGTVRDGAGNPVPFVAVTCNGIDAATRALPRGENARAMLTDKNGGYRFVGLAEGTWQLTFAPQQGGAPVAAQKVAIKGGIEMVVDSKLDR
jgi:hypothetical protein